MEKKDETVRTKKYVNRELCDAVMDGLKEKCGDHDRRISTLERKMDGINTKLIATLGGLSISLILLVVNILITVAR